MSMEAPRFDRRNAHDVAKEVETALGRKGWQGTEGEAGWALVRLFSRLAELTINRFNQVLDKHFLAFLNEAGVDLLVPRPAGTEITFTPAPGGPAVIRVPSGTQVATQQTETQPEVVFETQEDLTVTLSDLVHCITFDPRDYADRTMEAKGQGDDPFPAFRGQHERERILFLGDQELLEFADEASRLAATLTLSFELDLPGDPAADGWELEWLTYDGADWKDLVAAGASVIDGTRSFSRSGDVQLQGLPELAEAEVGGNAGLWLGCKLTGGETRKHLPALKNVKASRHIAISTSQTAAVDAAFNAIQANTSFVPLDPAREFFPLGQRPARLDAFYLTSEEAFSKQGATVALEIAGLEGVPAEATSPDLDNLQIVWEYHSTKGWMELGSSTRSEATPVRLDFDDQTRAFTVGGDEQTPRLVKFTVPVAGGSDPAFEKTVVHDQEGYWIRARIAAGSYNVPPSVDITSRLRGSYTFIEAVTYAPMIKALQVTYSDYGSEIKARNIASCLSQVDRMTRDHTLELAAQKPVAAFNAREEGPALYLGFNPALPAGEWIRLLLDVEEGAATLALPPAVIWEYWNGTRWSHLSASDESHELKMRGYLGFFAPADHQESTEFGQVAFWLRVRPHKQAPKAAAGGDRMELTKDDQITISLDASGSQVFTRQYISRYTWRVVSSYPPTSDAGADQMVATTTVTLDASGSKAAHGRPIVKYIWRTAEPEPELESLASPEPTATPYLRAIRSNTVPAINTVTVRDEVLGSSDGTEDQVFSLVYPPVHTEGIQIAVQEPDRPPEDELQQLEAELRQSDLEARALLTSAEERPVWVRWHQVSDFDESTPDSRHYVLDANQGQIHFGDGNRGKIPPVGHNSIRADLYRTHSGAEGNVQPGAVTVLRNPSDQVAKIQIVTNPEATAGGSPEETVDKVKLRGPQTLKHRQRAVTRGGFEWLSHEATTQVARTYGLPASNLVGLAEPGWVTVVILPESTEARPAPSPALVRRVKTHLEELALANLTTGLSQIYVKGPEYIEVTVQARIVPLDPTKADEVELDVRQRLNTFLHALRGGPEGRGWELGRNVYPSEIFAEIEAVQGVDHVVYVRLAGSLRQHYLHLREDSLPIASAGFIVGDQVVLVSADGDLLAGNIIIASLSADGITFDLPIDRPPDWARCDALTSPDGSLRLPLAPHHLVFDRMGRITGVRTGYWAPFDLRTGSEVSTFDKRVRVLLTEAVFKGEALTDLVIRDFKVGDRATIVGVDNRVLVDDLTISALEDDTITFAESFRPPEKLSLCDALMSVDRRLRLPLAADGITPDDAGLAVRATIQGFQPGDRVSVIAYGQRDPRLEGLPVQTVDPCEDRIYVPEGHLTYPGSHHLEMALE